MLDTKQWRTVLPAPAALPACVRRLIVEAPHGVVLLPETSPLVAPEHQDLEHVELRAVSFHLVYLGALDLNPPRRLTLQAGSHISVADDAIADVVHGARKLSACGRSLELCCPMRECICLSSGSVEDNVLSVQEQQQLLEELRSWFVETAHDTSI